MQYKALVLQGEQDRGSPNRREGDGKRTRQRKILNENHSPESRDNTLVSHVRKDITKYYRSYWEAVGVGLDLGWHHGEGIPREPGIVTGGSRAREGSAREEKG